MSNKLKYATDTAQSECNGLLFCDGCKFLSPSEENQTDKKETHMCLLLQMPLFHDGHHPHIPIPFDVKCPYISKK